MLLSLFSSITPFLIIIEIWPLNQHTALQSPLLSLRTESELELLEERLDTFLLSVAFHLLLSVYFFKLK